MSVEGELLAIAKTIATLQQRFVDSEKEQFMKSEDQAEFKRLAVEGKALMDEALGRLNDFSMNLVRGLNSGSGGFFGGPSYQTVGETAELLHGAVNHLRRRQLVTEAKLRVAALKTPYVDPSRLADLRSVKGKAWDLARLAQLCGELNVAHDNECHMTVAILLRAIVDHVPPVFGVRSFTEVANNIAGKSVKASMQKLDHSLRNIADTHLHIQIRPKESIPTGTQVDFRQALDVLLEEVLRLVR